MYFRDKTQHICDCGNKARYGARTCNSCAQLKSRYKLSYQQHKALKDKANGRCHICGLLEPGNLGVDYDPQSQLVRGLLCRKCRTISAFMSDPYLRAATLEYLGVSNPRVEENKIDTAPGEEAAIPTPSST